jgi:hypothetical protein
MALSRLHQPELILLLQLMALSHLHQLELLLLRPELDHPQSMAQLRLLLHQVMVHNHPSPPPSSHLSPQLPVDSKVDPQHLMLLPQQVLEEQHRRQPQQQLLEEQHRQPQQLLLEEQHRQPQQLLLEEQHRQPQQLLLEEQHRQSQQLLLEEQHRQPQQLQLGQQHRRQQLSPALNHRRRIRKL